MPEFRMVPLGEAKLRTATGRPARYAGEYAAYIQQLGREEAGVLAAGEGESVPTIKLTTTAELLGKVLTVKRVGDSLYFWVEPPPAPVEEEKEAGGGNAGGQRRPPGVAFQFPDQGLDCFVAPSPARRRRGPR